MRCLALVLLECGALMSPLPLPNREGIEHSKVVVLMPNSGQRVKTKIKQVRSVQDLRAWWNTIVDVRVKAIFVTGILTAFTIGGFQFQLNAQTAARIDAICEQRQESRQDLHDVLYEIVDLSDILPGNPEAEQYTVNRRAFIDANLGADGLGGPEVNGSCPTVD